MVIERVMGFLIVIETQSYTFFEFFTLKCGVEKFYKLAKQTFSLKTYCDIFLYGKRINVEQFVSPMCPALKGPGYFQGNTPLK